MGPIITSAFTNIWGGEQLYNWVLILFETEKGLEKNQKAFEAREE